MEHSYYRSSADISLDAVRKNIKNMQKSLQPNTKTCLVIKADGYGHGAVQIAKATGDLSDFYAVACIEEALELRSNKITKPILILGYVHSSDYKEAVEKNIRITVFDYDMAKKISRCASEIGKTAQIHIKLDTGMNRIGFKPIQDNLDIISRINKLKNVEIEGIFTHFHSADGKNLVSTKEQLRLFDEFCKELDGMGINIPVKHCSNSAATIKLNSANFDMVRMGVAIYGLYPSDYVKQLKLYPAMTLKSHITMIKTLNKGDSVGYNATWTANGPVKAATISIGYADGYLRNLSNKGCVLIRGKKAPIIGGVCMDQIIVDVSKIPDVKPLDEVILVGKSGDKTLSMEEVAKTGGTINYEFACGITRRVTRRYILNGKIVHISNY